MTAFDTPIITEELGEKPPKIGLYGAAATILPRNYRTPLKTYIRSTRDQFMLCAGQPVWLDYRNYLAENTYNRGDRAIIDAMETKLAPFVDSKNIVRIDWEKIENAELIENDKLLVCGSGYIFPNKKGQLPARLFQDAREIYTGKLELHLIGVGLNHLIDWNNPKIHLESSSAKLIEGLLDYATTVTVRDNASAQFLQRYTSREIKVIGDPALYLVNPKFNAEPYNRRHKIGISIPFHGVEPTQWIKQHFTGLARFLKNLRRLTSSEIHFLVHYDTEITIASALAMLGAVDKIVDGDTWTLLQAYGELDFHIGGMLHSCILSTAAGTPSIGLAYDIKHYGFFALMERSSYCLSSNSLQFRELEAMSIQILNNIHAERHQIAGKLDELTQRFDATLKSIMLN